MRTFRYRWVWRLQSPPEALWPFAADTNRFNRDTGVPALQAGEVDAAGQRRLRFARLGVRIEWVEEPFEWVEPNRFSVRRRYTCGPLAEMVVSVELEPAGGGTLVTYDVVARPRNILGLVGIPVQIGWLSRRRFERAFRRYDDAALARGGLAAAVAKPALAPGARGRLAAARDVLIADGFAVELVDPLLETVEAADDLDAARLGPYVLADGWQADRRTVLELCLHATRAGVLELRWDLLCPLCRGPRERSATLGDLSSSVHCDSCGVDFDADFEKSVELSFRPAATIRAAEAPEFCVGGPQLTPHVVAQQLLGPREERALALDLAVGLYRARTRDGASERSFVVSPEGPSDGTVELGPDGQASSERVTVGEHASLLLVNATDEALVAVVERPGRREQAVTAAEVTALQTFRDLFASEAIRPGEPIAVGTQTLLFTDLRDSTRFYREVGDAPAFGSVAEHLTLLRDAVAGEGGAVVKTMGDAIMAIFPRPALAVRAAVRAHREAASSANGRRPFVLKAGIHAGPCIAVNQNGRLDYFGTTVNVAARLVGLSSGGDLVVSNAVRSDPEVAELLEREIGAQPEPVEAALKGLEDEPLTIWRIRATTHEPDAAAAWS